MISSDLRSGLIGCAGSEAVDGGRRRSRLIESRRRNENALRKLQQIRRPPRELDFTRAGCGRTRRGRVPRNRPPSSRWQDPSDGINTDKVCQNLRPRESPPRLVARQAFSSARSAAKKNTNHRSDPRPLAAKKHSNRPSDGRGPGINPRPPCAFKMSMFNVFCNSH